MAYATTAVIADESGGNYGTVAVYADAHGATNSAGSPNRADAATYHAIEPNGFAGHQKYADVAAYADAITISRGEANYAGTAAYADARGALTLAGGAGAAPKEQTDA